MPRGRSDSDLVKMGIVDQPTANQRQSTRGGGGRSATGREEWIFQAEQLRQLLLGLVCRADPTKPPKAEDREIFEAFAYIEGQPYVRPLVRGDVWVVVAAIRAYFSVVSLVQNASGAFVSDCHFEAVVVERSRPAIQWK